ncbi:MAG: class II glutamine amidotransferase [Betaproteobacteria bacterium]|nr:MAG: class II glutamine amidotransferase [Betaproteobacteria bacterium]
MCELFAMSASQPTDVGPYLSRLMPRGGRTGPHADGWGVAYYEGRAARVFKDAFPAADSRYLALLARSRLKSTAVVAHIRKANPTTTAPCTANTHPFEREWNGHSWIFAHNGKLPGLHEIPRSPTSRFHPLGGTDSELAFCMLLDAIACEQGAAVALDPQSIVSAMEPLVRELDALGEFNFILSNGDHLFVHAHTRLHALEQSHPVDFDPASRVILATEPLTGEDWRPLAPGGIRVYRSGTIAN